VLAVFAPFGDARTIARLMHEVPGTASYPVVSASADPVSAVLESVTQLRGLIAGALVHAPGEPDERMTKLVTELASMRQAS
jgi:hypothetical protein